MMIGGTGEVMRKALYDAFSLPAFILLFTMMGFGSLARGAGFGAEMAALATVLIWGLPGQLAMVELTATGQGLVAIVCACSLANARFLPMVVSFVPAMSRARAPERHAARRAVVVDQFMGHVPAPVSRNRAAIPPPLLPDVREFDFAGRGRGNPDGLPRRGAVAREHIAGPDIYQPAVFRAGAGRGAGARGTPVDANRLRDDTGSTYPVAIGRFADYRHNRWQPRLRRRQVPA